MNLLLFGGGVVANLDINHAVVQACWATLHISPLVLYPTTSYVVCVDRPCPLALIILYSYFLFRVLALPPVR